MLRSPTYIARPIEGAYDVLSWPGLWMQVEGQAEIERLRRIVTRHGQDVVVVLAADTYRKLTGQVPDFKSFLRSAPDLSLLDLDQPERDLPRDVAL
jgi:hypothetical protein